MVWFSSQRTCRLLCLLVHLLALFTQCHASSDEDSNTVGVQSISNSDRNGDHVRYIMIVDAGSTGSRGFVYQMTISSTNASSGVQLQHIKAKGMKMTPGVSSFASRPHDIGAYFVPLFMNAASVVPPEHHAALEVHILGTAGMRLVSEADQGHIWDHVVSAMRDEERFPFRISRENVRTINGREEAYYAALSTNYIAKKIDSNLMPVDGAQLVGALDMGGSSTQLVLHTGTPPGQRVEESHFWSHSWLSFGVEKVRERVWKHFVHQAKSSTPHLNTENSEDRAAHVKTEIHIPVENSHTPSILNDCLFRNYSELFFDPAENKNEIYMMHGTGDVTKCKEALRSVLWPEGCTRTTERPSCSLDNIVHPPIAGNNFFGMSVYYFALDCVRFLGVTNLIHWPVSNVRELVEATDAFCAMEWHDVNGTYNHSVNANKGKHKKTSIEGLPFRCVEAMYMSLLLEEGFGFDLDDRSLTLALKVEGVEVEWTLGVLLTKALAHSTSFSTRNNSDSISSGDSEEVTKSSSDHVVFDPEKESSPEKEALPVKGIEKEQKGGEVTSEEVEVEVGEEEESGDVSPGAATESNAAAAAAAAAMEGIHARITALKAAGLSASTLKQLFPDINITEFFADDDNTLEGNDPLHASSEQEEHQSSSRPLRKPVTSSLRARIGNWKTAAHHRVILPVTTTSAAVVRHSKRAYGHVAKSFEMFAQVVMIPLDFLRGRSRYVGRWLYRKLFEIVHNRPL